MNIVFKYFWFLCGIWCGIGNGAFFWYRLPSAVESGAATRDEAKTFCLSLGLWILIPCFALGLLQESIDVESLPFFPLWPEPQRMIALGIQIFLWAALLYWIFLKNGADLTARLMSLAKVRHVQRYSPTIIKLISVAVVIAGTVSYFEFSNLPVKAFGQLSSKTRN
jgi:hypothetical protein